MSYLVLARKSRPQTFAQVVGQQAVVRTLKNGLIQNRVPHGLIFSGVRGTGKTTLARIMAKALNCEKNTPPEPCNECLSCKEIMAGSSVDLHEVDGASNRGIQEIRELKENIRFMPTSSRYKIIIIDEVHMLTTEAFNALLKTLEEPPDHVYFMFATTELHKVPVTILSRCQRYELQRVSRKELTSHFASLAAGEGVSIDEAALNMVVREAGGSVRDGLSLLDQIFSYCGATVTGKEVVDVLGLVSHEVIAELGNALLAADLSTALEKLDAVYSYGMDIKRFINELLSWFRALVICRESKQPELLLDMPGDELAVIRQTAEHYSSQTLLQMFNLLMNGLEKATYSAQPRFAVEMVFINAVQIGDVVPVTELLSRLDDVLTGVALPRAEKQPLPALPTAGQVQKTTTAPADAGEKKFAVTRTVDNTPEERRQPPAGDTPLPEQSESAGSSDKSPIESSSPDPPVEQPVEQQTEPVHNVREEQPPAPEPVPSVQSVPVKEVSRQKDIPDPPVVGENNPEIGKKRIKKTGEKDIRKDWPVFIKYVHERLPWMASTLQFADSTQLVDGKLLIKFEDSTYCSVLKTTEKLMLLTEFATDFFQENLQVQFKVPDVSGCETDPDSAAAVKKERQALASDPLVVTALDIFNGHLGNIRVGPRFRQTLHVEPENE